MIRLIIALPLLFALTLSLISPAQAQPVATVGSWSLELAEVDKQLSQKLYELREEKVQEIVINHLLGLEAKANNIAADQVLQKMVLDKIPPLSDADVAEFIKANAARLPDGGKGMEEKIRGYLLKQLQQNLQAAYLQSLTSKYNVTFLLETPRYDVPGPQDLVKGNKNAPITIIEFSDYECPYCRRAQKALKQVEKEYGNKIRFVFRHFPLPFHKKAPKASEAAQCAQDQKAFWSFHHALFKKDAELSVSAYKKLAKKLKLNSKKFNKCLDSDKYASRVAADKKDGKALGITGTPTFFVNGIKLVGAVPFSDFVEVIEKELAN
ncbi:MAG: DsbA family protein [Magnetococcales bacterium]|nr:DsbA family protein [Magnetococcales bacterium]